LLLSEFLCFRANARRYYDDLVIYAGFVGFIIEDGDLFWIYLLFAIYKVYTQGMFVPVALGISEYIEGEIYP